MIDIITAGKKFLDFIYNNNIFPAQFIKILDRSSSYSVKNDTREILNILVHRDKYSKNSASVLAAITENSNLLSPGSMGCNIYDWLERNKSSMITLHKILNRHAHNDIAPGELETALTIFNQLVKSAPVEHSAKEQTLRELARCDIDAVKTILGVLPVKKPTTYKIINDTDNRGDRKHKIMMACLEHGYQLTNQWNYATRNTKTDTYWVEPAIERFKNGFDIVLNDTQNHQLLILHIKGNTISPDMLRRKNQKQVSINLLPDTLRDNYSNISFRSCLVDKKIPFTDE